RPTRAVRTDRSHGHALCHSPLTTQANDSAHRNGACARPSRLPGMSTVSVRTATTADVADIARIQRRTWRVAYAELLGEQALAQLESTDVEQGWVATVEHVGTEVHLAIEADTIVGYCVTGPGPADEIAAADGSLPDDAEAVGLIGDLLVEPRWGRRGHG